jgi:hypothetical protein
MMAHAGFWIACADVIIAMGTPEDPREKTQEMPVSRAMKIDDGPRPARSCAEAVEMRIAGPRCLYGLSLALSALAVLPLFAIGCVFSLPQTSSIAIDGSGA